eukprot:CAMPEP_0174363034 /NCGR_PEP_ID=MMETSP0811_2-20130205/67068_1 /TAXON_ID=73025 ORGANISM="Eutreptiella gymnastica-like, Strain CCMP1594" /NCGR_SAMPLE_ID=MMETSP0811_2 /ASSEMBLY_ACC=CAM_ASM_000667 /LENGTH=104 /DNA_ID=CAMNT_0015501311 /DNA_START=16 /DNA_END=327 /DNA_ORIENTATION=+
MTKRLFAEVDFSEDEACAAQEGDKPKSKKRSREEGNPTKKRKLNKTPLAADTDGMATTTAASSSAKRRAVASDDDETGTITIITPDSPKRPQKGVAKAESASQS